MFIEGKSSEGPGLRNYFLAYFSPFLLWFLLDIFYLRHPHYVAAGDATLGYYGLGLDWLAKIPGGDIHTPGYTVSFISSLFTRFTGLLTRSLEPFHTLGIVFNIVLALGAAWWAAFSLRGLRISLWTTFVAAAAVASHPTQMAFATAMTANSLALIQFLPILLSLFLILTREKNNFYFVAGTFFAMGAVMANNFGFVPLAALLILSFVICLKPTEWSHLEEKFDSTRLNQKFLTAASLGSLILPFRTYLVLALHGRALPWSVFGVACLVLAGLIFYFWTRVKPILFAVVLPLISGWFLFCCGLYRSWGIAFVNAMHTKGSLTKENVPVFADFYPWDTLRHYPWILAMVLSWLAAVALGLAFWNKRAPRSILFPILVGLMMVPLNIVEAANVALIRISDERWQMGSLYGSIAARYFTATAILPFGLLCYLELQGRIRWQRFFGVAWLGVALLSMGQMLQVTKRYNEAAKRVDSIIQEHLKEPNNTLVCGRSEFSQVCSTLLAYTIPFRSDPAIKKISVAVAEDRQIRYMKYVDPTCLKSQKSLLLCGGWSEPLPPGKTLLVLKDQVIADQDLNAAGRILFSSPETGSFRIVAIGER